jgi:prepilin-type N-terminal cleavage/methylation domain-containing protein
MKTNTSTPSKRSGFTLIEMIGVLAIIAVLAALLIPRIFSAINESRISGAAMSYNSLKSAAMTYFGKYGRFGDAAGAAYSDAALAAPVVYDTVLLQAGVLEKPFTTKVGDTSPVNIALAAIGTVDPADFDAASVPAFNLDGVAPVNDATGRAVIYATLTNVSADDAKDLNDRIDGAGAPLGAALGAADVNGRVKFDAPANGVTTVYLYVAHK